MPTPQELLSLSSCFACYGLEMGQMFRIARLYQLSGTMITPQALLAQTNCYACYGLSIGTMLELALMDAVAQSILIGGGGSSSVQLSHGSGPPVAPPVAPSFDAIYMDNDENSASYGTKWSWDVDNAVWI